MQRKVQCPVPHLGVVAIEKGAFVSPASTAANFTLSIYIYIYIYIYMCVCVCVDVCVWMCVGVGVC